MPYEISMYEDEQYPPTWINLNYSIYGLPVGINQSIYIRHINNYIQNYSITVSWQNYCSNQNEVMPYVFKFLRNSFWYWVYCVVCLYYFFFVLCNILWYFFIKILFWILYIVLSRYILSTLLILVSNNLVNLLSKIFNLCIST